MHSLHPDFAQHSGPQEAMRPLPCCAVAVMLHAHMRLIAAFPQKLFWQLFVPRLIICTMQVAYGHSIIAHRVHSARAVPFVGA